VQKLAVFWGLVPHQIVNCEGDSHYYVCTVPLSVFLDWKLPTAFTDRILRGEVLVEPTDGPGIYDEFLFTNWIKDITRTEAEEVILLEIQARLKRMALHSFSDHAFQSYPVESSETSHVEKMAMYIAQNYKHPITASDIGKEVDLHPDYANTIFKKAFGCTLSEHITEERIGNAQRKLITGDESISEIAMNCGFNSISWFNATFKKITGLTPRRFRNEQKGDYLY
jgi:AraC-like DNA-binding protein